jgi:hypothetical protein
VTKGSPAEQLKYEIRALTKEDREAILDTAMGKKPSKIPVLAMKQGGRHRGAGGGLSPPTFMKGGADPPQFCHMLKIIIMQFSLFLLNMGRRPHFSPLTFFVVSPPL